MMTIFTDGATEGRNGKFGSVTHCGIGFYCQDVGYRHSERIRALSNNEAEFFAIIKAMEWAIGQGYLEAEFRLDSQIVVNRANRPINRSYTFFLNSPNSKKRHTAERAEAMTNFQAIVHDLAKKFRKIKFSWIPREQNAIADSLSKASLYTF